jgi:hypothetical protein
LLVSPYPAERVAAEAQTRLGAHLSAKGFSLVVAGPSGLTWRRSLEGKVLAGLVFLVLMALGGISGGVTDGDPGAALLGIACGVAAVALVRARRPATVTVGLRQYAAGCEIELQTSSHLEEVAALLRVIANASSVDRSLDEAKSAYFAGRIEADEFESVVADALGRES